MDKLSHKSEKIHHFLSKATGKVNLHEIKAQTGAGNGLKHNAKSNINNKNTSTNTNSTYTSSSLLDHKSERINHFIETTTEKLNLHQIKALTGAGNGFKHHNRNSSTPNNNTQNTSNNSDPLHKSEKIHHAVSNTEGKVNLHNIKNQTGAGNGFKHH